VKTVPTVRLVDACDAVALPDLPQEIQLALTDIAGAAREGLLAMSVAAGMAVMQVMFEAEISDVAGPKGKHDPNRAAIRHGSGRGSVTLGGRRVPVSRPRARTTDGHEVPLGTYTHFASDDLLSQVVMERMLAGLATRRHARTGEPVGAQIQDKQTSTSRSAISRRFVKQTETALAELMTRDLSGEDITVLMLDGEHMAERCVVVALAITADGTKKPVGLWEGSTENKTVVRSLLADLVERGLRFDDGLLVVLDGAKALSAGVREVFGDKALVQRCTLHRSRKESSCRGGAVGWCYRGEQLGGGAVTSGCRAVSAAVLLEEGSGVAHDVSDGASGDITEEFSEDVEGAQFALVEHGEQDAFAVADLLWKDSASGAGLAWAAAAAVAEAFGVSGLVYRESLCELEQLIAAHPGQSRGGQGFDDGGSGGADVVVEERKQVVGGAEAHRGAAGVVAVILEGFAGLFDEFADGAGTDFQQVSEHGHRADLPLVNEGDQDAGGIVEQRFAAAQFSGGPACPAAALLGVALLSPRGLGRGKRGAQLV
jgi:hypothetical protein